MGSKSRMKPARVPGPTQRTVEPPHHDVLFGYLAGHTVTGSFFKSFVDFMGHDLTGPRRLKQFMTIDAGVNLSTGRNDLMQYVLDDPQLQWFLMVDSDMGFERDLLDRLLAVADPVKRPVVGGLCFAMREAGSDGMGGRFTYPSPTLFTWQERTDKPGHFHFAGRDHYPVNQMIRVGATGGACLLIHRSAIEKIGGKWFDLKVGDDGETVQGEDISFCDRCRENDIDIWIHTGVRLTHYKHLWLDESDFWKSRVAPPATERVDVIVPTLGKRPENIPKLLKSLKATAGGLCTAWYVVEPDDEETIDLVHQYGGLVIQEAGTFPHKVNTAYRYLEQRPADSRHPHTAAPWVMLVGDDVQFQPAWLDQAQDVANRWGGDVVATNDLLNPRVLRGEHATHPLIRRSYIDEIGATFDDGPGVVCHEGYGHWYVDDEWTVAAMRRHVFQAALGSFVPHYHPIGGKVADDEVYQKGQATAEVDRKLFQRRLEAFVTKPAPEPVAEEPPKLRVMEPA